ncbi:TetR/AcrR family transcriptional regulator [Actinophytocola algeriensis]|uniref:AcrR family transcriptional regulator n=1 Tax=Actinophytocola algeriensis TaxID=1768010 RepID=A0A7W7QBZ5_9PSEU|nr:TetR/AcrR family transcriptional regulator [Actinophytocola algeriensis]MBB4910474.1 AcrR family transcriptional regulator [Actinophytocola algeriensis]MBE1480537.1 AcrR family transcriptional regulator [Actinophytocola algeriensis]
MPRPRSLTPDRLATATLTVIDRDGLDALTMRAVAKELGMATMSLYRYVTDKDELEMLVVDHVLSGVNLAVPPGDWRERITELLSRVRKQVLAHSAVVPLLLRHRHSVPSSMVLIEATLAILTDAGFAGERRVIAQRTIVAFLFGMLQNEHYGPLSGPGTAVMAAQERFPLLAETAALARDVAGDAEFHKGLAVVLRGLADG